jgi:hypothetical protein
MPEGDSWWWRFFDFLFTNSQLNVYAGARKVGDRHVGGRWPHYR